MGSTVSRALVFATTAVFAVALRASAEPSSSTSRPVHIHQKALDLAALKNLKAAEAFSNQDFHMVQLSGPLTKQMQTQLEAAGVRLADYLPEHAYLADLSRVKNGALKDMPFVTWVGRFEKSWKPAVDLGARRNATPERQALAARGETMVMVTLFAGRDADRTLESLKRLPGCAVHFIERVAGNEVMSVTMRVRDVSSLVELPDVQSIEDAPEISLRNVSSRWIVQTGVLDSTPFYTHGLTGLNQVVGITDSKVDVNHCSFFDVNPIGPTHRKILAYNTTTGLSTHGTHVAGIAVGDNGVNDETRGIAYGGKMVYAPVPVPDETGVYNALTLHHGQGALIHTNSWGNDGTRNYDGLCRGIDSFMYDNEDDLVLFATTNFGITTNPENAKNLVAVSAHQDTPGENLYCRGGLGPTADGRRKPDIMGPGCNIYSSLSGSGCQVFAQNGTSMASPAVAATAMLVRQYFTEGFYPSGQATPADVFTPSGALLKATLLNSTADVTGIAGFPSNQEGWGRVLLDNACFFPGDSRHTYIPGDVRNVNGLSTSQEISTVFRVIPSAEPMRVTLAWTDPPASSSIGLGAAWINDLDLEVTSPSNVVYLGNVFSGGVSVSGGTKDDKNNVEQLHLPSPEAGLWTVKVKAAAVNVGTQGYALILSGGVFPNLAAPTATAITPGGGDAETSVAVTDLAGTGFQSGATVALRRTGQPDVNAISVTVVNTSKITCSINLSGVVGGAWDVVVTNPDLQAATLPTAFTVSIDCLKGDVNLDSFVDGADIQRFVEILTGQAATNWEHCAGDIAPLRDGLLGLDDVEPFAECLLTGGCP